MNIRRNKGILCAISCLICIAMLIGINLPIHAEKTEKKNVKVGFFEFDGYHMMNENGTKSGYGYEFLQMIARYSDFVYDYIGYDKSWADMQKMLDRGEIDILTSVQKTPERLEKYDFTDLPIGTSSTMFTVKSGNTVIISGEYSTYMGIKVGMIQDNSRNESFADFAKEKGFTYESVYYEDTDELTEALQEGEIDGIVTSNLRITQNEWIMDEFDASGFYAIVKKGNKELLDRLNYAIGQLDLYDTGWRTELFSQYYAGDSGDNIPLDKEERAYITTLNNSGEKLKVCVNPDRYPYSYFEEGEAKGIIPEMFAEVARRLNIPYEVIETKSRTEYAKLLASGTVDICMDTLFNYSQAENSGYKLTEPIISMNVIKLQRKETTGEIQSVGALRETDLDYEYANKFHEGADIIYFDSVKEAVDAVKNREIDVTYLFTYSAQAEVSRDIRNTLTASFVPDHGETLAIGVADGKDYRLITILNKGIKSVSEEFVNEAIANNTHTMERHFSLTGYLYNYPLVVVICVCVVLTLLGIILLLLIKAKHAELDKQRNMELERFITYVCESNDVVAEVNLNENTFTQYTEDNGAVVLVKGNYKKDVNASSIIDYKRIFELCPKEEIDQLIEQGGGQRYFESSKLDEDGVVRWYSYLIKAITIDRKHPRNFVLFKKNIDEAKKEEEKNREIMSDALETARQASNAKGNFMSKMSHEIRTPLNAVIGYMAVAKMAEKDIDKVMHCIENSEEAAKHLLNIINDVLDISSIESGRMKIAKEDFDLKALLTSVSTMFYNQAKGKNVEFTVVINNLTDEWVVGDQMRLNQILLNLLSNAVKFTPENGKINFVIEQIPVDDRAVHIKFEISDTGIGMSEEYLTRLFQPFEQENAVTAQKYGGTGLGLSITKNLVTMMKGSIKVESKQYVGTTFVVSLMFGHSEMNRKRAGSDVKFSDIKILVVDDEKDTTDYITELLNRCGVYSEYATSGWEAIEKIKEKQGSHDGYNMCIIDWNMPEMDGVETARRIREECDKDVLLVIATAYDITEFEEKAKEVGVNKIISKPLFQSTMLDLLVNTYGKYHVTYVEEKTKLDLKGMHLLIVEDSEMNLEIAVDILQGTGAVIDTAVNGREAVNKFCASVPGTYDAILMDIQMPILDGYATTREIRSSSHPQAKDIVIIAMTANAFAEDVTAALASGMNDHVAKPVDYKKLIIALQKFVNKKGE